MVTITSTETHPWWEGVVTRKNGEKKGSIPSNYLTTNIS